LELKKTGEKDDYMILSDGRGNTGRFRFIDMLCYNGREYAAIEDESGECCIMEFIDGKEEKYIEIENDGVFEAVVKLFDENED